MADQNPEIYTVICLRESREEDTHNASPVKSGYVYEMELPVRVPRSTVKDENTDQPAS